MYDFVSIVFIFIIGAIFSLIDKSFMTTTAVGPVTHDDMLCGKINKAGGSYRSATYNLRCIISPIQT